MYNLFIVFIILFLYSFGFWYGCECMFNIHIALNLRQAKILWLTRHMHIFLSVLLETERFVEIENMSIHNMSLFWYSISNSNSQFHTKHKTTCRIFNRFVGFNILWIMIVKAEWIIFCCCCKPQIKYQKIKSD